jgi:transcriptional regulator with XRE-family HTH domain
MHRTYIGAVERGERNITIATLERIAAAFRVTPVDLLTEKKA